MSLNKFGVSLVPAADIAPGLIVQRTGERSCALATDATKATGQVIAGVMESGGEEGVVGTVTMVGPAKGRAGAAIVPGTHFRLTTNASGKFVPAADGDQVCALYTGLKTAADGHEIDVYMTPGGLQVAGA